jgi:hypothetical protein
MAGIVLDFPDIALFSDPVNTRVVLPRMSGQVRHRAFESTMVRFEGDTAPTPFSGEGRTVTYDLKIRFRGDELGHEHDVLLDLLDLFEAAHAAPDPRLLLRTNAGRVDGLNPIEVVIVSDVHETPVSGRVWDVTFVATAVEYSVEAA